MSTYAKHEGNRATDPGALFAASKEDFPPFGTVVDCEMDGTSNAQAFGHGLARIPHGGIVLSKDDSDSIAFLSAGIVEQLGEDPAKKIVLVPGGAFSGTVRMWVL